MKKALVLICITMTMLLFQSCLTLKKSQYKSFQLAMIEKNDLTLDRLKKLQFYSSGYFVTLRRELITSESKILTGKIVSLSGRYYEEIVLEPSTPGIAVDYDENKHILYISYEEGYYFEYGLDPFITPTPFCLRAYGEDGKKVMYGTKGLKYEYDIIVSASAHFWDDLRIRVEALRDVEGETRKIGGRKISD